MPIWNIPIENTDKKKDFTIGASLDGAEYIFLFRYNRREDRWYIDLINSAGVVLRAGLKVVIDYFLLYARAAQYTIPRGLIIINTGTDPKDPGFADLGVTSLMQYIDEADLDAL